MPWIMIVFVFAADEWKYISIFSTHVAACDRVEQLLMYTDFSTTILFTV